MLKAQEKITLIQLYKHASEELKVRLLQFLNNIYIYTYILKKFYPTLMETCRCNRNIYES